MDLSFLLYLPGYFLGYGVYALLFVALKNRPFAARKRSLLLQFDEVTSKLTALLGIFYFVLTCGIIFVGTFVFMPGNHSQLLDFERKPVASFFLLLPLVMCIFTQFFWTRKNRQRAWIKVIIALLALELFQTFILFLVSTEREYMPETGNTILNNVFFKWLLGIGIFLVCSLSVFGLSRLVRKRGANQ